MSLIDLDRAAGRPPDPGRQRPWWRWSRGTFVALLLGAAVGGLVVNRWTVEQQRNADERKVSVLIVADTGGGRAGDVIDDSTGPDGVRRMVFHAGISVVNTGPRAIQVHGLTAKKAGIAVAGSGGQWVSPGTASLVEVDVTWTCVAQQAGGGITVVGGGGILPTALSIGTVGGSVESVSPAGLDTTPWAAQWQASTDKCMESWMKGPGS